MKHTNSPSLYPYTLAYVVATVLFGLIVSIILSQTVAAQDGARGHERPSAEERQARIDAKFSEIDTNSDEMISQEELAAANLPHPRKGRHSGRGNHRGKQGSRSSDSTTTDESTQQHTEKRAEMLAKLFESMDSDSDGTLTKEEFAGLHAAKKGMMKQHMFQRMDKNADGFLSRDEFPPTHQRVWN